MDMEKLRSLLKPHVVRLYTSYTTPKLAELCDQLGLPYPAEEKFKRQILTDAFDSARLEDIPSVAERYLATQRPDARARNEIQDILWSDGNTVQVPKRYRRDVARAIESPDLYVDERRFDELLDRLWVMDDTLSETLGKILGFAGQPSLRSQIEHHVHRHPGSWSTEQVFDALGAFEASNRRFCLFLEGLCSGDVRPDERSQRRLVEAINKALQPCGVELRETGVEEGYPSFAFASTNQPLGKPKNLIFASKEKPDIRFKDAIVNHVEIVSNADKVLVYDRTIGSEGLRWKDLQAWWGQEQDLSDETKSSRALYVRLRDSLPDNSPPQKLLFKAFFSHFKDVFTDLPALLPEVWLHWDPKTVRERGPNALLRFRMDFLMLLPQGVRVVLEVDGKHHYAKDDGTADPTRYARMAAADRDLSLAGYYVFRFGAAELNEEAGEEAAARFFDSLFSRFKVPVPRRPTVTEEK